MGQPGAAGNGVWGVSRGVGVSGGAGALSVGGSSLVALSVVSSSESSAAVSKTILGWG